MIAFVATHSKWFADGFNGRSIAAALDAALRRTLARRAERRRFEETRKALLQLDARTLRDVVDLTPAAVRAMDGSVADRHRLGLS